MEVNKKVNFENNANVKTQNLKKTNNQDYKEYEYKSMPTVLNEKYDVVYKCLENTEVGGFSAGPQLSEARAFTPYQNGNNSNKILNNNKKLEENVSKKLCEFEEIANEINALNLNLFEHQKKSQNLNGKTSNTNEIKQIEQKKDALSLKLLEKIDEIKKLGEVAQKAESKINKIVSLIDKGFETRLLLTEVGGKRVKLITSDKIKLDATFLSADEFRKTIKAQGGEYITITRTPNDNLSKTVTARGIAFPADCLESENHLIFTLDKLKCFPDYSADDSSSLMRHGAGVNTVRIQTDEGEKLVIIDNNHYAPSWFNPQSKDSLFYVGEEGLPTIRPDENSKTTFSFSEVPKKAFKKPKSIILSGGNMSVYEMHKTEALAFLFQGMNVMLFNFRGHNLSEGIPSTEGLYLDYQTALGFVKEKTNCEDQDILLKALCMSGGVAAEIASRNPNINLFLDQTYSRISNVAQNMIKNAVVDYIVPENKGFMTPLKKAIANPVGKMLGYVGSFLTPTFTVADKIQKIKGHICLFYVKNDDTIPETETEENIKAMMKRQKENNINNVVIKSLGSHGGYWGNLALAPITWQKSYAQNQHLYKEYENLRNEYENYFKEHPELSDKEDAATYGLLIREKMMNIKNLESNYKKILENSQASEIPQEYKKNFDISLNSINDELNKILLPMYKIHSLLEEWEKNEGKEAFIKTLSGKKQMEHFLTKAKLNDPIVS